MAFYYYLQDKTIQGSEGPEIWPDFPVAPGGWLGWQVSMLKANEPGWIVATRNDLGLPFVKNGYGRYDEFGNDFKRVCNALGQTPETVRSWQP